MAAPAPHRPTPPPHQSPVAKAAPATPALAPPPAVPVRPVPTPSTTLAAPPPPAAPAAAAIEPSVWATVLVLTVLLPAALAALAGQHLVSSRRSR
ncbi:hypothetical protein ACIQF6_17520 [Kitasatospora sp. NPDC092948]|uniref:hypothetical protein n=1 Tax=Kitasatospora sp. NPDC092948 TaxID=3364088 RepID=UPI003826DF83